MNMFQAEASLLRQLINPACFAKHPLRDYSMIKMQPRLFQPAGMTILRIRVN